MKRDLLTQMKNEWRENIWLVVELLIVLLAVWYIAMLLTRVAVVHSIPKGFDAENVYSLYVNRQEPENPGYIDYGDEQAMKEGESLVRIMTRIRKSPHVEAAAFSHNALPYQYSYFGNGIWLNPQDTIFLSVNQRIASPDIVRVLRLKSLNGLSTEEMTGLLEKREVLIGSYKEFDRVADVREYLGRPLYKSASDSVPFTISHALIENIRRSEFDISYGGTCVAPLLDSDVLGGWSREVWEIAVRLRPGEEMAFINEFRDDIRMREDGNIYLGEPHSLMARRDLIHRTDMIQVRMLVGGTIFLLLVVFLGLFGTFWYRIRNREGEIAIRKVNGATRMDIVRRLLSEGMMLTAVSAIPAVCCGILYYHSVTQRYDGWEWQFIVSGIAALLLISATVTLGIIIPARKAMNLEPALTLKDE